MCIFLALFKEMWDVCVRHVISMWVYEVWVYEVWESFLCGSMRYICMCISLTLFKEMWDVCVRHEVWDVGVSVRCGSMKCGSHFYVGLWSVRCLWGARVISIEGSWLCESHFYVGLEVWVYEVWESFLCGSMKCEMSMRCESHFYRGVMTVWEWFLCGSRGVSLWSARLISM